MNQIVARSRQSPFQVFIGVSFQRLREPFEMDDGFVAVRSKRLGRKKRNARSNEISSSTDEVDPDYVRGKVEAAKNDLSCSEYWATLRKALRIESSANLVCLGLGQFSCGVTARWQTALLLLLKEHLGAERTVVYDPLFNTAERNLLSDWGCEIPPRNDEGFLVFGDSVFYMPHCGKPLFNSVVYANRKHLPSVTIFGNSFVAMFDQIDFQNRVKNGEFAALKLIENTFDEVSVENVFQYKDVFNDLSVISFRCELSEEIPRPVYSTEDEIILRQAMEGLSIDGNDPNPVE